MEVVRDEYIQAVESERSQAMCEAYDNKPVVYIGKIDERNGKILVKIGSRTGAMTSVQTRLLPPRA